MATKRWDDGADSQPSRQAGALYPHPANKQFSRRDFISKSAVSSAALFTAKMAPPFVHAQEGLRNQTGEMASTGETFSLENELIRIDVSALTGDFIGLHNKRSGNDYLGARNCAKAFRLNVPIPGRISGFNADYSANALDSWRQERCHVTRSRMEKSSSLTVHHAVLKSDAGEFPIEASYTIRLDDDSDEAILQLQVANHSSLTVKEVFFPWVSGLRAVEGVEADTFVAPNMIYPGTSLRDYANQQANWEEFPYLLGIPTWPDGYSLSMPWMNYGGQREGLYLASRARTGIHHMLMVQDYGSRGRPILAFSWAFPCYVAGGKTWRSPEMLLSLHEGDWHVGADKFRASLDGWYKRPQTELTFRRSFASFNSFYVDRNFTQLAELAEDISKYDLHHLVMWNFGDYYPKVMDPDDLSVNPPRLGQFSGQWGGRETLWAANRKARELGVSTGIIFSQRLWNKDTLTPPLHELAEDWTIRQESGDPIWESWDHQHLGAAQWSNQSHSFGHLDYVMCSAVEEYRRFAIENVRGVLKQAGYSMMFYDQVVEGNLCFSARHRHEDVSAPSVATLGFVEELKAGMKEDNQDAVLIGEGWEVLASQYLDSGWVWRVPPNPEVLRYTIPWALNTAAVEVDRSVANRYLVLGLQLAIVAGGLENGKNLSDYPEFASYLQRVAAFRRKTEQFWVGGTFQDDLGLESSGGFAKIYQTKSEIAVMVAELDGKGSIFAFALDAHRYGIEDGTYSIIWLNGESNTKSAVAGQGTFSGDMQLDPYDLAAIVFRTGEKLNA